MAAFNASLPAGYTIFDTMSMSCCGRNRNTYDRKTGELSFPIPENMQKHGRKFAIMCIDREGKVYVYENKSDSADLFTADIDFEGYAMCLIYMD
jgi:hypothetical protein